MGRVKCAVFSWAKLAAVADQESQNSKITFSAWATKIAFSLLVINM